MSRPANSFVANFGENNALPGRVEGKAAPFCHVRLETGAIVQALPVNVAKDGRTLVSIRPESLQIARGSGDEGNRLSASVLETIYFGGHVRLQVKVEATPLMLNCRGRGGGVNTWYDCYDRHDAPPICNRDACPFALVQARLLPDHTRGLRHRAASSDQSCKLVLVDFHAALSSSSASRPISFER
jgi:hypothetical protein